MEELTVRIPKKQSKSLDLLVDRGHYPNRSEAIRSAIRKLLGDELDEESDLMTSPTDGPSLGDIRKKGYAERLTPTREDESDPDGAKSSEDTALRIPLKSTDVLSDDIIHNDQKMLGTNSDPSDTGNERHDSNEMTKLRSKIENEQVQQRSELMKLFSSSTRVFLYLSLYEGKSVADISDESNVTKQALYQHIQKFRDAGLVNSSDKNGKYTFSKKGEQIVQWLINGLAVLNDNIDTNETDYRISSVNHTT